MAEKDQRQTYPLAPTNGYVRSDEEAAGSELSKELRRKKRMKCLAYAVAFAVFQTGVILLFSLTVMKIKNPKFRVRSATFETFEVVTSNPSFNLRMNAELGVKNTNFGHYKFDDSTITFSYKGVQVGSAIVQKARARARSTKKFNVVVDLSSTGLPSNLELGNDLNSGFIVLSSESRLKGKVELMKVMKKKKSTDMSCTMEVYISSQDVRNVKCK
ncbi:late embryogenesis abundant protein At1g64065-like [Cornus florida]|uniref:late embryogenesis abundant protein At1g64065-like n=1 Tax=Cornus florida TaxID=4283 RepID=UPI00289CD89A|nr:late embryogenesis abundant protein At1g64065-like [Cornus florida]